MDMEKSRGFILVFSISINCPLDYIMYSLVAESCSTIVRTYIIFAGTFRTENNYNIHNKTNRQKIYLIIIILIMSLK